MEHRVRGRRGERQSRWRSVHVVLADKGLHHLRVKGFTALSLFPVLVHRFHICRLQTSCFSLLLSSPSELFRNGGCLCMMSGTVGP